MGRYLDEGVPEDTRVPRPVVSSPVPEQPDRGEEPPALEPAELDSSLYDSILNGADRAIGTRDAMRPDETAAPRIPSRIISGADPSRVGGWDRLDQAYDATNARGQEAIQGAADISSNEHNDLAKHYANLKAEADSLRATRLQHQQENILELQERQRELDKQTKVYSQNLSDRGAFWRNPGNVVAAIGFALMPLGGSSPGTGVRLISNAVQQDLENRKQLADSHLGALRSNISGYRQLAGDIAAGDALAEAEAYRIAGLEVQRLASTYQSQKSQATAKAMMAELNGKMNEAYMRAFYQMININPQAVRDPRLANAQEARPGYQNMLPPGMRQPVPGAQGGMAPNGMPQQAGSAGSPGQAPSLGPNAGLSPRMAEAGPKAVSALGGTPSAERWKPGQEIGKGAVVADAEEQPVGGPGRDSWIEKKNPALAASIKKGVPHAAETWEITKNELMIQANRKASAEVDRVANPKAWERKRNQVWEELYNGLEKEKTEIAKAALPKKADYAHYSLIQKDMSEIEKAFGGDQNKINSWLYAAGGSTLSPATARDLREFWRKQGKEDVADRAIRAADRFKQLLNGAVVSYYHANAGANMTEAELDLLKGTISKTPSWGEARNFVRQQSSKLAEEYKAAIAHGSPNAQKLYLIENFADPSNLPSGGVRTPAKTNLPWGNQKEGSVDPKTNRVQVGPKVTR